MAMPWEYFCFVYSLVQYMAPLCLQSPQTQFFLAAWAGGTGQWLSQSFIDVYGKTPKKVPLTVTETVLALACLFK